MIGIVPGAMRWPRPIDFGDRGFAARREARVAGRALARDALALQTIAGEK